MESPHAHKDELRLWLRLLTCTNLIEVGNSENGWRSNFDTTLPRFDLLAQLDRAPQGMTLGDLSRRMMVTNGNITGLVERLVQSGHLKRFSLPNDRRVQIVKLTPKGQANFSRIASAHEEWIAEFFARLSPKDIDGLIQTLGKLKDSVKAIQPAPRALITPTLPLRDWRPRHFKLEVESGVARITPGAAGEKESTDIRKLCRAGAAVPRRRER